MSLGKKSKKQVDAVRQLVFDRDKRRCIVTGSMWSRLIPCGGNLTIQHAVARGMGSSAKYDEPVFLRTMCAVHNQMETSNALFAQACKRMGWSVSRWVADQANIEKVPVWYEDGWHLLKENERFPISPKQADANRDDIYGKANVDDMGQS